MPITTAHVPALTRALRADRSVSDRRGRRYGLRRLTLEARRCGLDDRLVTLARRGDLLNRAQDAAISPSDDTGLTGASATSCVRPASGRGPSTS